METMGIFDYYITLLSVAFYYPLTIFDIVAIVLYFAPHFKVFRVITSKSWYNNVKIVAAIAFAIMVMAGIIRAPYVMYQEKQAEVNELLEEYQAEIKTLEEQNETLQELYKPELLLEINNIKWGIDNNTGMIGGTFQLNVSNIGEKTAYQTQVKQVIADLRTPNKTFIPKELIEYNPIFKNERVTIHAETSWFKPYEGEETLTVLIYAKLKYSDASNGGYWTEQPFWFAIIIDTLHEKVTCKGAEQEWIDILKPYVN